MRVLILCLLLIASGCGGSRPSVPPPSPTANEPVPTAAPANSAPADAAQVTPVPAENQPPAAVEAKPTAEGGGTQSIFALLKVKEPKAFVASLDAMRANLEKAGAFAYVVSQGQDQTEMLIVHIVGRSGNELAAFVDAEKAKSGGLFANASEFFVAQDDAYQVPNPWPEQKTYDLFLRFKVKDYDAWRAHFDRNGEVRAAAGVIGYGIHRSLKDERVIVHYLAKSTDLLRQIASMPEITKLMKDQGIQGSPKPFYATNIAASNFATKKQ
ncbi:MAG TPA: hypothetical protein VER12_02505 [Polyangiaceae bacterium]|nr:hypothetical protein [Polyangiaceae bacterium]